MRYVTDDEEQGGTDLLRSKDSRDQRLDRLARELSQQGLTSASQAVARAHEAEAQDLLQQLQRRSPTVETRLLDAILTRCAVCVLI